jgi:hydroxymethylbilane synthase
LRAAWGDPEGALPLVQVQARASASGQLEAAALGTQVAQELMAGVTAAGGTLLTQDQPSGT